MKAARAFMAVSLGLLLAPEPMQMVAWAAPAADLRVLRTAGAVQLLLDGMGPNAEVRIGQKGMGLEVEITTSKEVQLANGIRQLALPEVGFASVVLEGSGNRFVLSVAPVQGRQVPTPVVSDDGLSLRLSFAAQQLPQRVSGSYDLRTPGQVPVANFVPPLRQRAYAPPVGDMAVGTMVLRNPSYVAIKGPPVTLTTRRASDRDVLMLLAQIGGYNFAYADGGAGINTKSAAGLITVSFQNESFERAFNFVLLSSGLQARLEGRTVVVGANVLAKTIGNQVSKVYRLNQVSPDGAADYLANLGATITKTNTITSTSNESSSTGVSTANASASTSSTSTQTVIESFGASQGPLKGLIGTTDKRLGTITLIGGSYLVNVAESYLKQLDLRKRQVAVNVKILNIDLENDTSIDNSFSTRIGNTFIVNDSGQALINFGTLKPPGEGLGSGKFDGSGTPLTAVTPFSFPDNGQLFGNRIQGAAPFSGNVLPKPGGGLQYARPGFGTYANPDQPGLGVSTYTLVPIVSATGAVTGYRAEETPGNPAIPKNMKYPNSLVDYLSATIQSRNTKTLADPTLLVQEGEKAKVEAITSVITNVQVTNNANNTTTSTTTRENAGLTLEVVAEKIDDNGFVTLKMTPQASIPVPAGTLSVGGADVAISNIVKRSLDSGKVRLRDGQTLFLTGVIQESDAALVSKWPVLGDLPFFGQFFRKTNTGRRKSELVIVVTPRIIDDEQGGSYGYGFQPSSAEARRLVYGQ
ncbi:general secretion pathway protein GspD [Synechococcus lacustris]|uniref:general secretion pathway protein GspD n=2 Tax=Synechococcus lacustris TaxID=2116544 RepID=UPI0020CDF7F3|nr:general secretion pathway protein GspD [Synechococcus lacustris]MCP9814777.1 general secretion pathway protein GspD [Synechococcus lacustris L1E-Slac]